jgi:hypothetical protein
MRLETYSYRYAQEILRYPSFRAWRGIIDIIKSLPLFTYAGKSAQNPAFDVVGQLLIAYFDRRLAMDNDWTYHPISTGSSNSELAVKFPKTLGKRKSISVLAEIQFGSMACWYNDILKFHAAYSRGLIDLGLSIVALSSLARRIGSNVVFFEEAKRELQASIPVSISLPILLIGIEPDKTTKSLNIRECDFPGIASITRSTDNRWRIVNGVLNGTPLGKIGLKSPVGPQPPPLAGRTTKSEGDRHAGWETNFLMLGNRSLRSIRWYASACPPAFR